jgi:hypothetical protein
MRMHAEVSIGQAELEYLKQASTFDWSKIPPKFRLGTSPTDTITLYKGAQRGKTSFFSHAVEERLMTKVEQVKETVEKGDERQIGELLSKHAGASNFSAFLSTTFNPELAQTFAPTTNQGKDFTIYKVELAVNRCIYDVFDHGRCGRSGENLVLGIIYPEEISAVKINNSDFESELLFRQPDGTILIRSIVPENSVNRGQKNPANWSKPNNG